MSAIKDDEVQEVTEVDPLTGSSIKPVSVRQRALGYTGRATESVLVEELTLFLSCIRRDLGSKERTENVSNTKPAETKGFEQKLDSFVSRVHQSLTPVIVEEEALSTKLDVSLDDSKVKDFKVDIVLETVEDRNRRIKTKIKVPLTDDYTCRYCQQLFDSKIQRQNHEKNVHPKTDVLCDICGQVTDVRRYPNHMKVHIHFRNFECTICSKRFKDNYDLKRHITTVHEHTSDFVCDICDKRLRSKKSMRKHMIQFHMSQLAMQCPECGRPFGDKSRLTRHLKVHKRARGEYIEEVKKEECTICKKLFANSTHLKQHMGKHSDERQFKCSMCPAAFNFHSSMRNHEKKVHERRTRPNKQKGAKGVSNSKEEPYEIKEQETILQVMQEPIQEELKLEFVNGPITIVTSDAQVLYQLPFNSNFQFSQ